MVVDLNLTREGSSTWVKGGGFEPTVTRSQQHTTHD